MRRNLDEVESYASRQLQRYDRRLLKVRALQETVYHWHGPRSGWYYRLGTLANRIIRKRDAFHVRVLYVMGER